MKKLISKAKFLLPVVVILSIASKSPDKWVVQKQELNSNWQIESSAKVTDTGHEISGSGFSTKSWYAALVPGTVLGSLVNDSVYKDVFFGRNLEKIPNDIFNVPWWYRTTFIVPEVNPGQIYRLRLNGISYRANVWLNGQKVALSDSIQGSFRQYTVNVTPFIKKGSNVLALEVTGKKDGELSVGFVDWNPDPADHNMGIWRNVELMTSGPVTVEDPFVQTKVDTVTFNHAEITVSAFLNNQTNKSITGELKGMIGDNIAFSQQVTLLPGSGSEVVFTPAQFAQLKMDHPNLWWVHTLGKPNLYDLHLKFYVGNELSDAEHIRFGIRSVSDYITKEGHRGYRLNGKKILIKGGGWADPMFLNATSDYEKAGIDYAVQMNLNTIRMEGFWGQNQHIYDLCDEKGILIMVGFSCQWEWANHMKSKENKYGCITSPEQVDMASRSWRDQILWLRNHPSIFLWLYGSDKWPSPELEQKYLDILRRDDPTRPSVASAAEHKSVLTGRTAVKMRGPYDFVPPNYWYVDSINGGAFGFNTETGPGPQIPVLESMVKMIPADSLWPISKSWIYHTARGPFHNLTAYNRAMDIRLGTSKDLNDYLRKAQYLNYEGMRAMFEAFESNRNKATGIIQWMYNASWPKLWWQLYDYYLMPTGAFYGARIANEPLHISYNYGKRCIDVMNNTSEITTGLTAEVNVLDFNLKSVLDKTITTDSLSAQSTREVFTLPVVPDISKSWFLNLRLYNNQHQLVSTNFYVLSTEKDELDNAKGNWYVTPQSHYADLTLLEQLPAVKLEKSEIITVKGEDTYVQVKLKNPSTSLAFMVYLDLKNKDKNTSIVPVFWDDNYFTLLPGEERNISGHFHTSDLQGGKLLVTVKGWNAE